MSRSLIVVPCYNEARRLDLSSFRDFLERKTDAIQFLFVDDGSTDDSSQVARKLVKAHPGVVTLVQFRGNFGKSAALVQFRGSAR